jgi:hypothetical protein
VTLSVNNCRMSRQRVAPSVARRAISADGRWPARARGLRHLRRRPGAPATRRRAAPEAVAASLPSATSSRARFGSEVAVGDRILFCKMSCHCGHVRLGLRDSDPGLQPGKNAIGIISSPPR